ncbi:MAG: Gfo/Idh/MocA family oxidoreductase [Acidimicrobiia bacterium]|nr:Gfo/Idh/MocA family oxidoreductase [Acidimicrobiia bacterium]
MSHAGRVPVQLPIGERPVRIAVVGLGQISELALPAYAGCDSVEVVSLCDRRKERLERWRPVFPDAACTDDIDEMLGWDADVVDVLVPTPTHADVVCRVLDAGFNVQVQKPLARSLAEADRMLAAAEASGALFRVMEDYFFHPPLVKLREIVESGELGAPRAVHMKLVATGWGGWDVDLSSYEWQFEQIKDGRGLLTFDHGWHELALTHWLFGPVRRIFGWIGETVVVPELDPDATIDAPATFVWEHADGVRGVLDVTFAPATYFKSDYYSGDERVEVTCEKGYVRANRISAYGVQEPSVEVYKDGEIHSYHALDSSLADSFARMADYTASLFRTGEPEVLLTGADARQILVTLLTGLDSSEEGRPLDVPDPTH